MKDFASTLGAVGIGVAARDCPWPRADANAVRRTKLSKGRNMNGNTLVKSALVYSLRESGACLVHGEMCIVYAAALQRRHDAIEFRNIGNGTNAHPVHFAACDE